MSPNASTRCQMFGPVFHRCAVDHIPGTVLCITSLAVKNCSFLNLQYCPTGFIKSMVVKHKLRAKELIRHSGSLLQTARHNLNVHTFIYRLILNNNKLISINISTDSPRLSS
jgi:hypothetical protein